jgi:predicted enzyme related to lactoylglutathione lyase
MVKKLLSRLVRPDLVAKPVLPVDDMARAVEFYRSLGFRVDAYDAGYAWVHEGDAEFLHLRLVVGLDVGSNAASVFLHVQDADAWFARVAAALGDAVGAIADMPWKMREFAFTDPFGNLVRVGQTL